MNASVKKILWQNLIGVLVGGTIGFGFYSLVYLPLANAAHRPAHSEIISYSMVREGDYIGLSSIAARKALDLHADVKLVYSAKAGCDALASSGFASEKWAAQPAVSSAAFVSGTWRELTARGDSVPIRVLCSNVEQQDIPYLLISSPTLRSALARNGQSAEFVAIGN